MESHCRMLRAAAVSALLFMISCALHSSFATRIAPFPMLPEPSPPAGCEIVTCKTGCRFFRQIARAESTAAFGPRVCNAFGALQNRQFGVRAEYTVLRQYRSGKCRVECGPLVIGESVLRCDSRDNRYGKRFVFRSGVPCNREDFDKNEYSCRAFTSDPEDCDPELGSGRRMEG